mgnify:FL=1
MEIIRENLTVNAQSFLEGLAIIDGINTQNFDYSKGLLTLDVVDGWLNEASLDTLITSVTISETYIKIKIENAVINSIREFRKKVKKEGSIKDKIQSYEYNSTDSILIVYADIDWTTTNTTTLDTLIDNLVGYDVITQLMASYVQKSSDGVVYYNQKRSELVESIIQGIRTSAEAFEIDGKIKDVKDSLLTGDWITSQTYLGLTVVEGAYTQALKDEFNTEIQLYIDENY